MTLALILLGHLAHCDESPQPKAQDHVIHMITPTRVRFEGDTIDLQQLRERLRPLVQGTGMKDRPPVILKVDNPQLLLKELDGVLNALVDVRIYDISIAAGDSKSASFPIPVATSPFISFFIDGAMFTPQKGIVMDRVQIDGIEAAAPRSEFLWLELGGDETITQYIDAVKLMNTKGWRWCNWIRRDHSE